MQRRHSIGFIGNFYSQRCQNLCLGLVSSSGFKHYVRHQRHAWLPTVKFLCLFTSPGGHDRGARCRHYGSISHWNHLAIGDDTNIPGIQRGDKEHKLFLYADDILALVKDPDKSFPHLMETVQSYSKVSRYKINWTKSEATPIFGICNANR